MKKKLVKLLLVYDYFEKHRKILIMTNLFFFLVFINMQLYAGMLGQKTVSMNLQNASLFEMLGSIEEQTGVGFLYNESEINTSEKININVSNMLLGELLNDVLPKLGVDFEFDESVIILTAHKEQKEDVVVESIVEEAIEIKGKITDKDGLSLPGATVMEKGTLNGVITDYDGNFSLTVAGSASVLKVSFIGFETQFIEVGNETVFNIVLAQSAISLNEVIVVGYGTKSKNEITGSTVQINGEELSKMPVASVDQALQGKVPGLTITSSSGTPGTPQDIRIRGVGSITAGNEPLFVIDGVPMINDNLNGASGSISSLGTLAAINSSDIESMTVLKDASATSAYGARGSNGVIVITTKKGKSGKTQFSFNATYGFQNEATEGKAVLNAFQKKELFLEAIHNTFGIAEDETEAYVLSTNIAGAGNMLTTWDGKNHDWKEIIKNKDAIVKNYNLSAIGGDDKSNFYASVGYNFTEGTVIGIDFKRITGVFNYKRTLHKKVLFTTSMNVSNSAQNGFHEGSDAGTADFLNPFTTRNMMSPYVNPYDENGEINTSDALTGGLYNWLYLAENDITKNNMTRAITNTSVEWEIIENLKFKTVVGLDYNLVATKLYQNRHYGDYAYNNGSATAIETRNFNSVFQNSLDYNFVYKENHHFSFKALMEYQKNKYNYIYAYGENFPSDDLTNVDNAGSNKDAGSSFTDWKNLSYLGMINYNYKGKYIADFTFRREGSSRFVENLRFGNFWSVGAAWNMSQEDFLSDVEWINSLRLRASYGKSGSSQIGINQYQALLSYDADYNDNGGIYPSQYGNEKLTWEKNKTLDIGVDYSFFDNKLSGSFAYFHKKTYDLLQQVPISESSGHSYITQNIGAVVNKGIEAVVNFDVLRSEDFNINVSVNFATLDNNVTKLAVDANGDEIEIAGISVGHPIREWYLKKWAGVNPDNGLPQWYLNGVDGELTNSYASAEKAYQGKSPIPKYTGGVNLHVDYKGFFVDANVYFAGGHAVLESSTSYITWHTGIITTLLYNGVADLMNRWQEPGDIADFPKVTFDGSGYSASSTSSRMLYDGDYARLKDLVFGYDFKKNMLSKMGLDGLRLYVRGTNLLTWVKDKKMGYDPEVRADGYTNLTTPPVKSVVFGINVNF